jgi:hypothetical protein
MNDADLEGIELENIIVGHRRTRPTQRFTPPPNDGPFIDDVDPAPIRPAGNGSWAPNFNPPPDLEAEQQHSDGGYHDGNGSRAPNFNSPRDLEGEQEDYDIGHQDGNDDVNEDDPAESVDDDNEAILEYQKDLPSMTLSTAARTMARRMMMTTTPPPNIDDDSNDNKNVVKSRKTGQTTMERYLQHHSYQHHSKRGMEEDDDNDAIV